MPQKSKMEIFCKQTCLSPQLLGAYSVSKTALLGLVKALAAECAPAGVRVNGIAPGVIKTDFSSRVCPYYAILCMFLWHSVLTEFWVKMLSWMRMANIFQLFNELCLWDKWFTFSGTKKTALVTSPFLRLEFYNFEGGPSVFRKD